MGAIELIPIKTITHGLDSKSKLAQNLDFERGHEFETFNLEIQR